MKHPRLPWVILLSSEMAHYFLGQCRLGKHSFEAWKQLGLLPWQVSCGVFSLGVDCSWAFFSGTGRTLWHFLWCSLVLGCGGCWRWDMGWKRHIPHGKCVPAWAGSARLKNCALSLPLTREGRGAVSGWAVYLAKCLATNFALVWQLCFHF